MLSSGGDTAVIIDSERARARRRKQLKIYLHFVGNLTTLTNQKFEKHDALELLFHRVVRLGSQVGCVYFFSGKSRRKFRVAL